MPGATASMFSGERLLLPVARASALADEVVVIYEPVSVSDGPMYSLEAGSVAERFLIRTAREANVPVLPLKLESSALREVALVDRRDVLP